MPRRDRHSIPQASESCVALFVVFRSEYRDRLLDRGEHCFRSLELPVFLDSLMGQGASGKHVEEAQAS
jgi:hypothetical protein